MKFSNNFKLLLGIVTVMLVGFFLPSCKSKKKCPDFTQVEGKVRIDKNGLVKKKRHKRFNTNRSSPTF